MAVSTDALERYRQRRALQDKNPNAIAQTPNIPSLPKPKDILTMVDITGGGNELKKIIDAYMGEEDIEGKSELNKGQIVAFAKAAVYVDRYNSKTGALLIMKLLKFLKSKDRAGLKELVDLGTGFLKMEAIDKGKEKVEL